MSRRGRCTAMLITAGVFNRNYGIKASSWRGRKIWCWMTVIPTPTLASDGNDRREHFWSSAGIHSLPPALVGGGSFVPDSDEQQPRPANALGPGGHLA